MKPSSEQIEVARAYVRNQPWPWTAIAADPAEIVRTVAALIAEREAAARDAALLEAAEIAREDPNKPNGWHLGGIIANRIDALRTSSASREG